MTLEFFQAFLSLAPVLHVKRRNAKLVCLGTRFSGLYSGSRLDLINFYTLLPLSHVPSFVPRGWRHPGTSGLATQDYPRGQ